VEGDLPILVRPSEFFLHRVIPTVIVAGLTNPIDQERGVPAILTAIGGGGGGGEEVGVGHGVFPFETGFD
jgi:hypothetical protein